MSENTRVLWNARMRGRARAGFRRRQSRLLGARRLRRRRYNYPSIRAEPKHLETFVTAGTSVVSNATFASALVNPSATQLISTPAVGDSYNNRDGKKIIITSVEIKGMVNLTQKADQATPPIGTRCFVALILDTQTNQANPTTSDIFGNYDTTPPNANWSFPLKNLLTGGRFRILKMKYFKVTTQPFVHDGTNFEWAGVQRHFKFYRKLRLPVNFNGGTTADVANVQDNSLHVIAWADVADWDIGYVARIRFIG